MLMQVHISKEGFAFSPPTNTNPAQQGTRNQEAPQRWVRLTKPDFARTGRCSRGFISLGFQDWFVGFNLLALRMPQVLLISVVWFACHSKIIAPVEALLCINYSV